MGKSGEAVVKCINTFLDGKYPDIIFGLTLVEG